MAKLPKRLRDHIERCILEDGYGDDGWCIYCLSIVNTGSEHKIDCPTREALRWLRKQP